jgi:hypothetical protein
MIGDFNINMGGISNGNNIIYVNAQSTPTPPTTQSSTREPTRTPTLAPTRAPTRAPTQAPNKDPARERISQFVEEGQMFFVREDEIALGRSLSNPIFPFTTNQVCNIEWFCTPAFPPGNNNGGDYGNVVSSFITFVTKKMKQIYLIILVVIPLLGVVQTLVRMKNVVRIVK